MLKYSTCSRAWRASMPYVSRVLCALVPHMFRALYALVTHVLGIVRAFVHNVLRVYRAFVPHVSHALYAVVPCVPLVPLICSHPSLFISFWWSFLGNLLQLKWKQYVGNTLKWWSALTNNMACSNCFHRNNSDTNPDSVFQDISS